MPNHFRIFEIPFEKEKFFYEGRWYWKQPIKKEEMENSGIEVKYYFNSYIRIPKPSTRSILQESNEVIRNLGKEVIRYEKPKKKLKRIPKTLEKLKKDQKNLKKLKKELSRNLNKLMAKDSDIVIVEE